MWSASSLAQLENESRVSLMYLVKSAKLRPCISLLWAPLCMGLSLGLDNASAQGALKLQFEILQELLESLVRSDLSRKKTAFLTNPNPNQTMYIYMYKSRP